MLFRKLKLDWKYGISELLIVVAGVLIALAANGLLQERQDRSLELEYVEGLIADLRLDTAQLSIHIAEAEERMHYARVVLSAFDAGLRMLSPAEFARAVEFGTYFSYPTYSRSTIDDLMSTGNLRLVRSKELKDSLARYYAEIDWTEQFSETNRQIQADLVRIKPELLDIEHRNAMLRERTGGPPWAPAELIVSDADADLILERLLARPQVRSGYASMARMQGMQHTNLTTIYGLATAALGTLERYVEAPR